jgi:hypothetical protein
VRPQVVRREPVDTGASRAGSRDVFEFSGDAFLTLKAPTFRPGKSQACRYCHALVES